MRRALLICCSVLLALAIFSFAAAPPTAGKKGAAGKKATPALSLKDPDGKPVSLADYKGKVVLLNFWATWCGPCKIEMPWFVDFENRYKSKGFAVVGVSMDDEGLEAVKPWLAKNKLNYKILIGNEKIASDWGGLESLPTTFIIDRDGTIYKHHVGLVSKDDYEKDIKTLLDRKADAGAAVGVVAARANKP